MNVEFNYKADGQTIADFLSDDRSFVRGLRGPIGGGKSVACCIALFINALAQVRQPDGTRRSRYAVVRNTAPQLRTTTVKTWLDWFPEGTYGNFRWAAPYTHHIKIAGELDMEVIFLALDVPEDVKKLLSLELTGAWINEAREVPKEIVDALTSRVDRYPGLRDGGAVKPMIVMDTNSPSEEHWWPIMAGEAPPGEWLSEEDLLTLQKPPNWAFYTQPAAMEEDYDKNGVLTGYHINPKRENQSGVLDRYYTSILGGKDRQWINVYIMNRLGTLKEGKPIYPSFRDEAHVGKEPLTILDGITVEIGIDFGLTPAALFAQRLGDRWLIQRELVADNMGAKRFGERITRMLVQAYPANAHVRVTGDPSGDNRAQTDEKTAFQLMRSQGIPVQAAPTNSFDIRVEAVEQAFNRLSEGKPAILIDPSCKRLIQACRGGYQYRKIQREGRTRFEERPDKNMDSHIAEAFQYLLLGGGEGRVVTRGPEFLKPSIAQWGGRSWTQRQRNFFPKKEMG